MSLLLCLIPVLLSLGCLSLPSKRTRYYYEPAYGAESPEFLRSLQALRSGIRPGNKVSLLENGDGLFPDMVQEIRKAQKSINIEVYIFDNGEIGSTIADALCERAKAGVEVRVLVDDFGSRTRALASRMQAAGVKLRDYKPLRIYALHRVEHRTHRKIVVVDGRIGYCGGFGFDDRWKGNVRSRDEWRDLAVKVEGPTAAQLQMIFLEDWLHTTGEVLHGNTQFPAVDMQGEMLVQAIASSRSDQASIAKLMMYMAIQAAQKKIYIANAYFVPDSQIRIALIKAAERGVDVRVVVPGPNMDISPVLHACRYYQSELIKGGVKVYEFQPAMLHTKAMVVDGIWATIGSINFSSRSFKKNAEANVLVYDYGFAVKLENAIMDDIRNSREITMIESKKRGICARLKQFWSSLVADSF